MYPLPLWHALSPVNQGGGTHGFPIPSCMCVHACVWFFRLDYPIPPGSLSPHEGGHPHVHLALGPLGFFPLWGGHVASTLNPNTRLNVSQTGN